MKNIGMTQQDIADFIGVSRSHLSTTKSRQFPLASEASFLISFLQHCHDHIDASQLEDVSEEHQHKMKTEETAYRSKRIAKIELELSKKRQVLEKMELGYQNALKLKCLAELALKQLPMNITDREIKIETLHLQSIKAELALHKYAKWKQLKVYGGIIRLEAELEFLSKENITTNFE